jgi:hypothetical protein
MAGSAGGLLVHIQPVRAAANHSPSLLLEPVVAERREETQLLSMIVLLLLLLQPHQIN